MRLSFKVAPGVRLSAGSRGVRASVGPRAARVHVGGGRPGISTGAGPVTFYSSLASTRRTSPTGSSGSARASGPTPAALRKATEAQVADELLSALETLHHQQFVEVSRPVAPMTSVDVEQIRQHYRQAALAGLPRFGAKAARSAATAQAVRDAEDEAQRQFRAAQQATASRQAELESPWV